MSLISRIRTAFDTPASGRRGLFPKSDGWYDIDSTGTQTKVVTQAGGQTKEYKAILTGTNGANPTAVVTKNDLSAAIVWTRTNEGEYEGTLVGAFPAAKTTVFVSFGNGADLSFHAWRGSDDVIEILSSAAGAADFIGDLYILIQVEP